MNSIPVDYKIFSVLAIRDIELQKLIEEKYNRPFTFIPHHDEGLYRLMELSESEENDIQKWIEDGDAWVSSYMIIQQLINDGHLPKLPVLVE